MFRFAAAAAALLLLSNIVAADDAAATMCSNGPDIPTRLYHNDGVCNRLEFNRFKSNLNRPAMRQKLQAMGGANLVPDQKTVICPLEEVDLTPAAGQVTTTGFDTIWMVENTASTPVVIAYVDQKNGMEYSAVNSHISPPQADPQAILQPGQWKPIYTFEGHVFHVRELNSDDGTTGRLLVQHRAGLVPIGANIDPALLVNCPLQDVEPAKDPNFQRTPPRDNRPCNIVDLGFRNRAGCPIHAYFVRATGDTCQEEFRFHLGVHAETDDFANAWPSTTKYESSFMGHTYVFRLGSNPAVVVDKVTMQPTKIIDCPKRTVQAGIAVGSLGLLAPVHRDLFQNATSGELSYNVTPPTMTASGLVYASAATAGLTSL